MRTSPLKASVVLCTFQGERFLPAQLASLRGQTESPAEVLAQDDGSTDSTREILRADPAVSLHVNERRLGFAGNFSSAVAKAKGDVIFLCDQDDVWEARKIATMLGHFERDPSLQLACSEATRIDEAGKPLPGPLLGPNGLTRQERERWANGNALPFLLRRNAVPGMTMAFRAGFRDKFLPVPEGWEHDYWILLVAAALNLPILVEPDPLVRYRQHAAQAIGGGKSLLLRFRRGHALADRSREAQRWDALLARALPGNRPPILGKREHLARRGAFPRRLLPRALAITRELWRGDYSLYDAGPSSAVKDLLSS